MIGDASTESHARFAAGRNQVNFALCHSISCLVLGHLI